MQSAARVPARQVVRGVLATEGVAGFYRGFLPNALKNMPNKGNRQALRISAVERAIKTMCILDAHWGSAAFCYSANCPNPRSVFCRLLARGRCLL